MDSSILRRAAGLVGAGLLGGALVLGGVGVFGGGLGGRTTTVRELVNSGPSSAPASFQTGRRLSINQIYRRSAPGVVQVTSTSVVRLDNTVPSVVAQLIAKGSVEHASLGIAGVAIDREIANLFHFPVTHGVLIANVKSGSGAAKAGLRGATTQAVVAGVTWPIGGDLIVKADGGTIGSLERLREGIAGKKPGDTLPLQTSRGDRSRTTSRRGWRAKRSGSVWRLRKYVRIVQTKSDSWPQKAPRQLSR